MRLRPHHPSLRLAWVAALLSGALLASAPLRAAGDAWSPPAPDSCAPKGGLVSSPGASADASAQLPFQPGDVFDVDRLQTLEKFLPAFLWPYRDRFFFEGMRLEIGPCFRDYGPPDFYREATRRFLGKPHLSPKGGLLDYTAGQPFPLERIASDPDQAGLQWLWNVAMRYQAAGFRGKFRITDLLGRVGRAEPFEGEIFQILLAHRADRAADGYEAPGARHRQFVAGGLFTRPFNAKEFAWRQYRDVAQERDPDRSDELQAYIPTARRVRRLNSARVEGLYMPSFSVGAQQNQKLPGLGGGGQFGAGGGGGLGGGGGTAGGPGGTIQTQRSGYEGLVLRPSWHRARVLGLHDVLTPINAQTPAYPERPDRGFGPWGLSFASDRWDLRRALVLELRATGSHAGGSYAREILYVDLQTLMPLYIATFDAKEEMTNVGIFVSRWSEDRPDYPPWPDDPDRPVRVLDPVGAAFANLSESGSWRRESWTHVSTPPSDRVVKRMLSVGQLTRRR